MEQNIKNAIKSMREEIAALEKVQKNTKEQRKTVNFHGERTMHHWVATEQAKQNKQTLRAMYAAYGLLRGKKFNETENKAKLLNDGTHPLTQYLPEINDFLEKYGYGLPFEKKKNYWGQEYKSFNTENCEEIVCFSQQEA